MIGAFFDFYNELAGFPEFALRRAMASAIRERGLAVVEEENSCQYGSGVTES